MLCGMQEIARLLAAHSPFDGVAAGGAGADRSHGGDRLLPRGASILRQGGEPSRYLHVIVKGVVELRQTDDRGYWRSSGRTLAAWGPLGPDVTSNSTAGPHQVSGSQP